MKKRLQSQRGFNSLIIIGAVTALLLVTGGFLFLKSNRVINIPGLRPLKGIPQDKRLIVLQVQKKSKAFYSIDPSTKEKKELLRFDANTVINQAQVSPDGRKLYYIPSELPDFPRGVIILSNKGERKEFDMAKNELWTLPSTGYHTGEMAVSKDCFWSPSGEKLACMLIQREGPQGAGTGRDKIVVLDSISGDVLDVFNSDQIEPPRGPIVLSTFGGWVGNDKLLYVRTKENIIGDIKPADFYTIDIKTKAVKKEFSYPYDTGFKIAISPRREEVFFQSFSRIKEDKFVKYNLNSKQDTILVSTKDVLGVTHPVISEDGSKVIFTTYVFLKSPQEIDVLKPETLKGAGRTEIHVYDLTRNQEEIIRTPEPIGFVEALLPDNKTFIVNKTPEGSVLFDRETLSFEGLNGSFIGFGYF